MKKLNLFLNLLILLFLFTPLTFAKTKKKKPNPEPIIEQAIPSSEAERTIFSLRKQERWIKAALEYKKFLETLSPEEQRRREAEAAEIFFKARLYKDAATYYAKLAERSPNAEVLDKLVSSYVRSNQFDAALTALDQLEAVSSKSAPSLEYRRIFILVDANRCETAIPLIDRYLDAYPKSQKADEALWQKLWCEYQLGKPEKALATLNGYEALYGSKTNPGRVSYWRMRFLEASGKKDEAERERQNLIGQDHFYAEWLKQQKGKNECPSKNLIDHSSYAGLTSSDPGVQELVQRFSKKEKVPEKLIWAIMYQESRFRTEAKSPVGASGLLQLMPETGYDMAESLEISPFDPDDLTNPSLNIHLGVHYLAFLLEKFSGNLPYAIAAYNAGPDAVERWTKLRNKNSCDEFIETIPYRETNNYVRKVLGYYWN